MKATELQESLVQYRVSAGLACDGDVVFHQCWCCTFTVLRWEELLWLALSLTYLCYFASSRCARYCVSLLTYLKNHKSKHTHIRLMALCPGLPGWAGTRKVKPMWISLKQEIVSGRGISWAICKSAPRCRQITMPAPTTLFFYRPDALPAAQPTASKHWRLHTTHLNFTKYSVHVTM